MNKLGDVVFCVDCDEARSRALSRLGTPQTQQTRLAQQAQQSLDVEDDQVAGPAVTEPTAIEPVGSESVAPPRRMATKKDANGDPLCSACLDERQSRRRAEFMLTDDRRTVVHWTPNGRNGRNGKSSNGAKGNGVQQNGADGQEKSARDLSEFQLALDPELVDGVAALSRMTTVDDDFDADSTPSESARNTQTSTSGRLSKASFVRNLPADMPAKEVITRARKVGLELTAAYVYVIRSNAVRADIRAAANGKNGKSANETSHTLTKANGHGSGQPKNGKAQPTLRSAPANGRSAAEPKRSAPQKQLTLSGLKGQAGSSARTSAPARDPKAIRRSEQRFMWLATEVGFFHTQQLIDRLRSRLRNAVSRNAVSRNAVSRNAVSRNRRPQRQNRNTSASL